MQHEIAQYENILPPGFNSWTRFFERLKSYKDQGSIFLLASNANMGVFRWNSEGERLENGLVTGPFEVQLDVDFLKARLFDEIMEQVTYKPEILSDLKNEIMGKGLMNRPGRMPMAMIMRNLVFIKVLVLTENCR